MEEVKFMVLYGAKVVRPIDLYRYPDITKEIILKVFEYDRNAFLIGCGKESMVYNFHAVTGEWYHPKRLRATIEKYFEPIKSPGKCTRFDMNTEKESVEC